MNDYYQRGMECLEAGKMKEAEEAFLIVISENPEHVMAHNKLGLVYARIEEFNRAKEFFQKALELDPMLIHAWNNLGNIARQEGNLEQARDYYQKALEADPGNPIPEHNLRVIEKQLKWRPNFLQVFRKNKSDKT